MLPRARPCPVPLGYQDAIRHKPQPGPTDETPKRLLFIPFAYLTPNAHLRRKYLWDFCEIPFQGFLLGCSKIKRDPFRHRRAVLVSQVAVGLGDQHAAVFVA